MSILADIRGAGCTIRLKPDGGLGFAGPDHLIPVVKAHRAEIIKTLQAEAMFGIEYRNSALEAKIYHHYCVWHKQCDSEERTQALSLLLEWDDALSLNMKAGALRILSEWKVMEDLVTRVPLAGKTLDKTIRQMIAQPQRVAVAVTQPKGQPVTVTQPAAESKQETMPFFEPLPPKPKIDIVTIDPAAFGQAVAAVVTAEAFG